MNVHVFLLVFLLIFALALLCALCWPHPGPALSGAAKVRTALPRLLKPRSPHDCPACRLASTASSVGGPVSPDVAPLARGEKPAWSSQAHPYRRLRLSQPAVQILWQHRRSLPCASRRWQAWSCRANPDVSVSGLPHHVQCPTRHPHVPPENPFPPGRHGADLALAEGLDPISRPRGSSTFDQPRLPGGSHALASTHTPCTSASSAICGSRTCNWTNCEPGCAAIDRCSGSGWPLIL
jgi:hypothetical protein